MPVLSLSATFGFVALQLLSSVNAEVKNYELNIQNAQLAPNGVSRSYVENAMASLAWTDDIAN